uniref:Ligament intra-crystalline peptide n=1 Tax=Pinctada fucata TaxID=50426 RepID=A0A0A1GQ43_PINFU|nr:ligament intra-crystalline peptide [Pinctada fucata]
MNPTEIVVYVAVFVAMAMQAVLGQPDHEGTYDYLQQYNTGYRY